MKRIFAILLAIVMLASACSGGDGLAIETTDGAASVDAGDSGSSDTGTDTGNADKSDAVDEEPAPDEPSSDNGSSGGDWCVRANSFDEQIDALNFADGLGAISQVRDAMELIFSDAPAEIKGDVAVALEGISSIVDALEDAGGDFERIDTEVLAELENPKYEEASDNIDVYLGEVCGIDVDDLDIDDSSLDGIDIDIDDLEDLDITDVLDEDGNINIPDVFVTQMADAFIDSGMSSEDANCLANAMSANGIDAENATDFFQFLETCGMSMADIANLGG